VQQIRMLLADRLAVFPLELDGWVKQFNVLDRPPSDFFESRRSIAADLGWMTAPDLGEVVSLDAM
jgi:hypothetical protein